MTRISLIGIILVLLLSMTVVGQTAQNPAPPVVDTIVVVTRNVFGAEEARRNMMFRLANSLHVTTQVLVVRRELLFRVGEPYDADLVAETERNLRRLGIFRNVSIDSMRIGSRLAVVVETADGWTTQLDLGARSTGGTFTWSVGLVERNLLGTATQAGASYRKDADRTATTFLVGKDRALGSEIAVGGVYENLSDGKRGGWNIGIPWRALTDRNFFELRGSAARERVLRYRDGNPDPADSVQRRSIFQTAQVAHAVRATPTGYVRIGLGAQVLKREHITYADTGLPIPDSVTGIVGVFGAVSASRYKVVNHYNGFARDFDLDLSSRLSLTTWLAPTAFGYERNGFGADIGIQTGVSLGSGFATIQGKANALFTSAGVDSGQAWVGVTLAAMPRNRHATVFHIEAGAQRGIPFGAEYDIGHGFGPRAFEAHEFTGTRMIWGALEHRAFLIDEVLGMLGIGFAGFVDYGGAWFEDEPRRMAGDVGFGLRLGATRATGPNVGRIDLAYRFGDGVDGKRWVLSFGRGFAF